MSGFLRSPTQGTKSGVWQRSQRFARKAKATCEDCRVSAPTYGIPREHRKRWCSECAGAHLAEGALYLVGDPEEERAKVLEMERAGLDEGFLSLCLNIHGCMGNPY
jgi:hypothetical protein